MTGSLLVFTAAVLALIAVITLQPAPALAQIPPELDEALQFHGRENYSRAVQIYTEFLKDHPRNVEALNWRGMAYDELGDQAKALQDFNKAIELSPKYADAYNNRGEVYRKQKKYGQALKDFQKAVELEKDFAEPYFNMGIVYEQQDKAGLAAKRYQEYLKLNPQDQQQEQIQQRIAELKKEAATQPAKPKPKPRKKPGERKPERKPRPAPEKKAEPKPAPVPGLPEGAVPMEQLPPEAKALVGTVMGLMATMGILFLVIPIVSYIFFAVMLLLMAQKTNTPLGFLGFIPIAQNYLMTRIAGLPIIWFVLMLIPALAPFALMLAPVDPSGGIIVSALAGILGLLGVVAWFKVWIGMASARGKSIIWGILGAIPCTTIIGAGYLGLSR